MRFNLIFLCFIISYSFLDGKEAITIPGPTITAAIAIITPRYGICNNAQSTTDTANIPSILLPLLKISTLFPNNPAVEIITIAHAIVINKPYSANNANDALIPMIVNNNKNATTGTTITTIKPDIITRSNLVSIVSEILTKDLGATSSNNPQITNT